MSGLALVAHARGARVSGSDRAESSYLKRLVAAGLGVTIYPKSLIGFLGSNVETRPISHSAFRIQTVLAWKRTNRTRAVRSFIEIAKSQSAPS